MKTLAAYLKYCYFEDIQSGDITAAAIFSKKAKKFGKIVAKQEGIFSGNELAKLLFKLFAKNSKILTILDDGQSFKKGDVLLEFYGNAIELLSLERTLLNFLQHLCGVATTTNQYVLSLGKSKARIYDTRKTTPGMRFLEKAAVIHGGGKNHRLGLFDAILIKENYIVAAGSITKAVQNVIKSKAYKKQQNDPNFFIQVETTSLEEVREAVDLPIDIIMLDNMSIDMMQSAIKLIRKNSSSIKIEVSGNVTKERLSELAKLDVDRISVGAITHSALPVDLSCLFDK